MKYINIYEILCVCVCVCFPTHTTHTFPSCILIINSLCCSCFTQQNFPIYSLMAKNPWSQYLVLPFQAASPVPQSASSRDKSPTEQLSEWHLSIP